VKSRRTAILALTALAASGCGVGVHFADYRQTVTLSDTHLTGPVSDIQVSSDAGHVTISTGGDGVTIHRVVHYQHGTPHPGQQLTNGTLTFSKGCAQCRVDYDLTVPASVRVKAHSDSGRVDVANVASATAQSDSGSVTVRHITGDVTATTDSGSVTVEEVHGTFRAHSDSGSIHAIALASAKVEASTDSGGVRIEFAAVPTSVRATSDSGSLHIGVPGGQYNIETHTDSGGKDIDPVLFNGAAANKIYLSTDSGGVSVQPATAN
jgi:hypothetical protein